MTGPGMITMRAPVPVAPRWMVGGGRGAVLGPEAVSAEEPVEGLTVAEAEHVQWLAGVESAEAGARAEAELTVTAEAALPYPTARAVRPRRLAELRQALADRAAGRLRARVALDGRGLEAMAGGALLGGEGVESFAGGATGLEGGPGEPGGRGVAEGSADAAPVEAAALRVAAEVGRWSDAAAVGQTVSEAADGRRVVRRPEAGRSGGARRAEFDADEDLRLELGR